jgi:hypothetical protein
MGEETRAMGIADAKCFSNVNTTGLAILNKVGHVWAINSVNTRVLWKVQDAGRHSEVPTCWTIITSPLKPTAVLFWSKSSFSLAIQESIPQTCTFEWALKDGDYVTAEPNADHSFLALSHTSRVLQIVTGDLRSELYRIALDNDKLNAFKWYRTLKTCINKFLGAEIVPWHLPARPAL